MSTSRLGLSRIEGDGSFIGQSEEGGFLKGTRKVNVYLDGLRNRYAGNQAKEENNGQVNFSGRASRIGGGIQHSARLSSVASSPQLVQVSVRCGSKPGIKRSNSKSSNLTDVGERIKQIASDVKQKMGSP